MKPSSTSTKQHCNLPAINNNNTGNMLRHYYTISTNPLCAERLLKWHSSKTTTVLGGIVQTKFQATPARRFLRSTPKSFAENKQEATTSNSKNNSTANDIKNNPFFGKYSNKIDRVIDTNITTTTKNLAKLDKHNQSTATSATKSPASTGSGSDSNGWNISRYQQTRQKSLDDIVKLDLLRDKSSTDIAHIWNSRHLSKSGCVSAVVPSDTYLTERIMANKYPVFLLPVPRDQGFEFFVLQWSGDEIHFASLLSYQAHGESSTPVLSLSHYGELKDSHNIILMRGEYDTTVLKPLEVQCLLNQLQLYYSMPDANRLELLETFTKHPQKFQHMRIVEEIMRVGAVPSL